MIELLRRHGPSGPHAVTVLLAEAAAMIQGRDNKGVAEMAWEEFSRFGGIDPSEARERLSELAEAPFTLIVVESDHALGFRVRFPRWKEWDVAPKDPTAAERKRRQRERERDES